MNYIPYFHPDIHFRMMHIHPGSGESLKDSLSQRSIHLHGGHGIGFMSPSCIYLKGKFLILKGFLHIPDYLASKIINRDILHMDHRTESYDAEHMLQSRNHCIIVIILALHLSKDTSTFILGNCELPVHLLQGIFYLLDKGIFKDIPVLPLNPYLAVFNKK